MKRPFTSSPLWSLRAVLVIYTLGFLIGTYTHTAGLLRQGFLGFPVPLLIGIYWDMLTLLDPITALLLWWRPKVGLGLAVNIMASDVSINTYVYLAGFLGPPESRTRCH